MPPDKSSFCGCNVQVEPIRHNLSSEGSLLAVILPQNQLKFFHDDADSTSHMRIIVNGLVEVCLGCVDYDFVLWN